MNQQQDQQCKLQTAAKSNQLCRRSCGLMNKAVDSGERHGGIREEPARHAAPTKRALGTRPRAEFEETGQAETKRAGINRPLFVSDLLVG